MLRIQEAPSDPVLLGNVTAPKFLTRELARKVVNMKFQEILDPTSSLGRLISDKEREDGFCLVILVPGIQDDGPELMGWLRQQFVPVCLYEIFVGDRKKWPYPFRDIVRSKARQIWDGRSDGRSVNPHLLFPGDTPYWGGTKQDGVVVACSGFKQEVDRLVSVEVASQFIRFATMEWELSAARENEVTFLT